MFLPERVPRSSFFAKTRTEHGTLGFFDKFLFTPNAFFRNRKTADGFDGQEANNTTDSCTWGDTVVVRKLV